MVTNYVVFIFNPKRIEQKTIIMATYTQILHQIVYSTLKGLFGRLLLTYSAFTHKIVYF
jgi:hypothetical protein